MAFPDVKKKMPPPVLAIGISEKPKAPPFGGKGPSGKPSPFGGKSSPFGSKADSGEKPDFMGGSPDELPAGPGMDQDDDGIDPTAVSYRTGDQKCQACKYFESGMCSKLKTDVEPDASCNLFAAGSEDVGDEGGMGMGMAGGDDGGEYGG